MTHKPEIFAVIWLDAMLGRLSLHRDSATAAIELAQSIRVRGGDKVAKVRAVHLSSEDVLTVLDGDAMEA